MKEQASARQHFRPELEGRVHDLFVGTRAESGDCVGPWRVDDALRQVRLDDAVEAGVQRDIWKKVLDPATMAENAEPNEALRKHPTAGSDPERS